MSKDSEIVATLAQVTTATLTTLLLKKGLRNVWMRGTRPLNAGQPRLVGKAFTLRFIPAREDLNPIEEALAYRRLTDEFHLKQDQIADAVGKDRASVANFLRLLKLPDEVRAEVAAGTLSMGHARALLGLAGEDDQRRTARDVIARGLSVRETESLVKKIVENGKPQRETAELKPADVHTRAAEDRLKLLLGTRVRIVRQGTKGRIEIDFVSEEELIRIYDQLTER